MLEFSEHKEIIAKDCDTSEPAESLIGSNRGGYKAAAAVGTLETRKPQSVVKVSSAYTSTQISSMHSSLLSLMTAKPFMILSHNKS